MSLIRIKAEINLLKNRETVKLINKSKIWFFEKKDKKLDKP